MKFEIKSVCTSLVLHILFYALRFFSHASDWFFYLHRDKIYEKDKVFNSILLMPCNDNAQKKVLLIRNKKKKDDIYSIVLIHFTDTNKHFL